jgi:hypothetical protein
LKAWQVLETQSGCVATWATAIFRCRVPTRSSVTWHVAHVVEGRFPSAWHAMQPGPPVASWVEETFVPWHPAIVQMPAAALCFAARPGWKVSISPPWQLVHTIVGAVPALWHAPHPGMPVPLCSAITSVTWQLGVTHPLTGAV